MIVRPVQESDLDDLKSLASSAMVGLTSLPNDEAYLKEKITDSLRAFDEKVSKPRGESYFFVLEDPQTKNVVGTTGIIAKVGGFEPYYTYKITHEDYCDDKLGVDHSMALLELEENHNGPSEICSLFLAPSLRGKGQGRLLSLSRFLFMAQFKNRFEQTVISELRGYVDDSGKSPFWESVTRPFFKTEFSQADFLSGIGHKSFIHNLMPKHPIFISLLPKNVQETIGKVHKNTEPALKLLQSEGFKILNEVDIFDAGPTVQASIDEIRTIKHSTQCTVNKTDLDQEAGNLMLISTNNLDFRATVSAVGLESSNNITIPQQVADWLKISTGDSVSVVSLKGGV